MEQTGNEGGIGTETMTPLRSVSDASQGRSPEGWEDPWKTKVVLTLDGGGVRGYGSLLMLQALMQEVQRLERIDDQEGGAHDSSFQPYPQPKKKDKHHSRRGTGTNGDATRERTETSTTLTVAPSPESRSSEERLKPSLSGYLPCHYFDYIGGTSTGGLNAVMLGRLRMSVDQCVEEYPYMAQQIFSNPRRQFKGWPKDKYDARQLEEAVQNIVRSRTGNGKSQDNSKQYLKEFESPDDLCRTFVVANKRPPEGNSDDLCVFRSYNNPRPPNVDLFPTLGDASKDPIWQICRATSAAPTFFEEIDIGGSYYSDGGLGYNNPAEEGYFEVANKEGVYSPNNTTQAAPIRLFLSIGTGGKDQVRRGDAPADAQPREDGTGKRRRGKRWILRHLSDLSHRLEKQAVQVEAVNKRMRERSHHQHWPYFRWTGGEDLALLRLDKWKAKSGDQPSITQTHIETWVNTYMDDPARAENIRTIARILVDTRRQRVRYKDGDMWQRFAHCSHYVCPVCQTDDYRKVGTESQFRVHLRVDHGTQMDISKFARFSPKIEGGPF